MKPPKYDGTIHPEGWIKQIQIFCQIKQITTEQEILKICKLSINSNINIPQESINTISKLIKTLKENPFHIMFKNTAKRKLQYMKYVTERDGGDTVKFIGDFCSLCYDAEINNEINEVKKYLKKALSNNELLQEEFANRMKNVESMDELVKKFDEIIYGIYSIKARKPLPAYFPKYNFITESKQCKHVKDSVNVKKLKEKLPNLILSDIKCVTCVRNNAKTLSDKTSTWLCLACCKPHCGRYDEKHGIQHGEENINHTISLDLETIRAWCYECCDFVIPSTNRNQVVAQAQAVIVQRYFKENEMEVGDENESSENVGNNFPDIDIRCKHVKDSVNVKKLEEMLLIPSDIKCVTCVKNNAKASLKQQTIWLCLACGKPHCSRFDKQHGIQHFEKNMNHTISLCLKTFNAWCYECQAYIFPSPNRNQVVAMAQAIIVQKYLETKEDESSENMEIDFSDSNIICKHVKDSVNIKKLKEMFSIPSDIKCLTCVKNRTMTSSNQQTIWLCLACGKPHCGRFDELHGIQHFEENANHTISLDLETFNAWCYECHAYVVPSVNRNQVVAQAQAVLRRLKIKN